MEKINRSDGITLREYFETRFDSVAVQIEDIEKATKIALTTLDKRLEGMNEFRDTLRDQAALFINRTEFQLVVNRLEQDIKNLETARATMVTIVAYDAAHKDLVKQVDELRISRALLEGKASQESVAAVGGRALWGIVFGAIATALAIINFISRFTGT